MSGENFNQMVGDWIDHCKQPTVQLSSNSASVIDCDSYRKIVSMKYEALPLIRQIYDKDSSDNFALSIVQGHGLVSLVREIIGDDFVIPEAFRGNISAMESYTKNWLDDNMSKYVSSR